jgi:dCTP deaminase
MILTDEQILIEIQNKNIIIEPFRIECLGTNSYDVHLGKYLAIYRDNVLDVKSNNQVGCFEIDKDKGFILQPHILYLGVTEEYTETIKHVPFIEGKSSIGRLGINIHATAGKGDVGFKNHWTLEISVIHPVRIYPFMPIGQLIYFEVKGNVNTSYDKKINAQYTGVSDKPIESKMYKYFENINNI